jgi:hypothetical protein
MYVLCRFTWRVVVFFFSGGFCSVFSDFAPVHVPISFRLLLTDENLRQK